MDALAILTDAPKGKLPEEKLCDSCEEYKVKTDRQRYKALSNKHRYYRGKHWAEAPSGHKKARVRQITERAFSKLRRDFRFLSREERKNAPFRLKVRLPYGPPVVAYYNQPHDAALGAVAWLDAMQKDPRIKADLGKRVFKNGPTHKWQVITKLDGSLTSLKPWCDKFDAYQRGTILQWIPRGDTNGNQRQVAL